jgi:hypothetical protein
VHRMHPTAAGVGAGAGCGFFNAESQRRRAAEIRNTVVAGWCIECTLRRLALGRQQDGALNAPYGGFAQFGGFPGAVWRWGSGILPVQTDQTV